MSKLFADMTPEEYEAVMAEIEEQDRELRAEWEAQMDLVCEVQWLEHILESVASDFEQDPGLYMRFY